MSVTTYNLILEPRPRRGRVAPADLPDSLSGGFMGNVDHTDRPRIASPGRTEYPVTRGCCETDLCVVYHDCTDIRVGSAAIAYHTGLFRAIFSRGKSRVNHRGGKRAREKGSSYFCAVKGRFLRPAPWNEGFSVVCLLSGFRGYPLILCVGQLRESLRFTKDIIILQE